MLLGTFKHNLDSKNRLALPSKFRSQLQEIVYILKGYDGAVSVYCEEGLKDLIKSINSLPFNQKDSRDIARLTLASVVELQIDASGRIQIPKDVVINYNITKEVVVIGLVDHFEIWSKSTWEEYVEKGNREFETIAERLPFQKNG